MKEKYMTTRIIPEISEIKKQAFFEIDPDKRYLLGCGDDRQPTAESLEKIRREFGTEAEQVRFYGAIFGISRDAAAILYAHGYGEMLDNFSSFAEFSNFIKSSLDTTHPHIIASTHSADSNEGSSSEFDVQRENGVGCMYAAAISTVTEFNLDDNIASAADDEINRYEASESNDSPGNVIIEANRHVQAKFVSAGGGVSREDMTALNIPISILKGAHGSIRGDHVKAVVNFIPTMISNPEIANASGEPFYCNDVTLVAKIIASLFPDKEFQATTLLGILIEDIAATREALAQHDPLDKNLHVHDLAVERHGSYADALEYLRTLPNVS